MFEEPPPTPHRRRADATRNRAAIVRAAVRVLADAPSSSMAEIAEAAGVGRATLYRHFPTRETLERTIRFQAMHEAESAISESNPDHGEPHEALGRLTRALVEVGDRYRLLSQQDTVDLADDARRDHEQRIGRQIAAVIERGKSTGQFDPHMPTLWGVRVLGAVVVAAVRKISIGDHDLDEASALAGRTVVKALANAA